MPERKTAARSAPRSATRTAATGKAATKWSAEERAAMRSHAQEIRRAAGRGPKVSKEEEENDVQAAIAAMSDPDRAMAERVHALIKASSAALTSRTWYGMPAYAKDGSVVCFFQPGQKFKTRYATLGFSDKAQLDDGDMWPNAFALKTLSPGVEARITALVQRAVG